MIVPRRIKNLAKPSGATISSAQFTRHTGFFDAIEALGLDVSLKVCLDAGDVASYNLGGKWLDLSGNGHDFFLGTSAAAQSSDPTYEGTPGLLKRGNAFAFDGGDYLVYDSTSEAWMDRLHQDGALFTAAWWVRPAAGVNGLLGSSGSVATNHGITCFCNTSNGVLNFQAYNGSGVAALATSGIDVDVAADEWQFLATSVDEAAGLVRHHRNGVSSDTAATFSSPSASAATYALGIGTSGNGNNLMQAGGRMAGVMIWEGVALSDANLGDIFDATKSRFGL